MGVIRLSSIEVSETPLARPSALSARMERSFHMVKTWPPRPMRGTPTKAGPRSLRRTANPSTAMNGHTTISAAAATTRSRVERACIQRLIGSP